MPQPKPPESYRKPCSLCHKPRDVLVRCQIDESITNTLVSTNTDPNANNNNPDPSSSTTSPSSSTNQPTLKPNTWHFVCPGSCWKRVSGGVIDGDLKEGREGYRYGGMWKNKHAGVSAKVPRRLKGKLGRDGGGGGGSGEVEGGKEGSGDGEGDGEEV